MIESQPGVTTTRPTRLREVSNDFFYESGGKGLSWHRVIVNDRFKLF